MLGMCPAIAGDRPLPALFQLHLSSCFSSIFSIFLSPIHSKVPASLATMPSFKSPSDDDPFFKRFFMMFYMFLECFSRGFSCQQWLLLSFLLLLWFFVGIY